MADTSLPPEPAPELPPPTPTPVPAPAPAKPPLLDRLLHWPPLEERMERWWDANTT